MSILFLLILSGAVFAFQKNEQNKQDGKSLLEEFSSGGFKNMQVDNDDELEDLKNYSSQTVLVDDIIDNNSSEKQKFSITQSLGFFAKLGNDLFGIKKEKIFQPVNKIVELRESIKIPKIIKVPEDYELIQLAIDNAEAGDTVEVAVGEYKENIVMKKGVSLVGSNELAIVENDKFEEKTEEEKESDSEASESDSFSSSVSAGRIIINETIINGGNFGNVVTFKNGITNKTEFAGFTIKNSGKSLGGIFIEDSSPWIHDNILAENEYNIYIKGKSSPTIQKNIIQFASKGIQVYNFEKRENFAQEAFIQDIGANSEKTEEEKESDSEASESDSFSSSVSVLSKPIIIDNLITDNKIGIDLYQASAIINHNTISYNNHYKTYLGATFGIYIKDSSAKISNNIITDSGICDLCAGINVDEESKDIVLKYNNIWNNKNNFVCFGKCVMEDNNFSEDPMFVDYINGDYKLSEESGLIGKSEKGLDIGIRWE